MARAKRRTRASSAPQSRGRGWRWLALGLAALCLIAITRKPLENAAREIDMGLGYRRVESFATLLNENGARSGIDPNLLAGVMLAESSGRVDAVSSAGALGLFQLMLPTARERARLLGLREPTREELLSDPALNMRLGADYLRWLERRYDGRLEAMLVAYNAGPGRLDGWIRDSGGFESWRKKRERAGDSQVLAYASKVLRYRKKFAERGVIESVRARERVVFDHPSLPQPAPTLSSEIAPETGTAFDESVYGPLLAPRRAGEAVPLKERRL